MPILWRKCFKDRTSTTGNPIRFREEPTATARSVLSMLSALWPRQSRTHCFSPGRRPTPRVTTAPSTVRSPAGIAPPTRSCKSCAESFEFANRRRSRILALRTSSASHPPPLCPCYSSRLLNFRKRLRRSNLIKRGRLFHAPLPLLERLIRYNSSATCIPTPLFSYRSLPPLQSTGTGSMDADESCEEGTAGSRWRCFFHGHWHAEDSGLLGFRRPRALLSHQFISQKDRPCRYQGELAGNEVDHAINRRRDCPQHFPAEDHGHAQRWSDQLRRHERKRTRAGSLTQHDSGKSKR